MPGRGEGGVSGEEAVEEVGARAELVEDEEDGG